MNVWRTGARNRASLRYEHAPRARPPLLLRLPRAHLADHNLHRFFLSLFETCARSDTFTPATHASLNEILYSTLLQASPSALPLSSHSLPRTASPNWPTFKLSDVQRDARKLNVKGKGKERDVGEAGTAGEKGQVGVGDLDKMGWRKDRCERAFERGDLVYRIKCVPPLLLLSPKKTVLTHLARLVFSFACCSS